MAMRSLDLGMLVERFDIQQVYGKGYCSSKVRSGGFRQNLL